MDRTTGRRRGSLVAIGAGIRPGLHLTLETRMRIERADDVLYLLAELAPTSWIHTLNPSARSMLELYQPGRDQREVYEELVETALEGVRRGRDVCMVTYGNPGVFDDSCHEAVRRARQEGYEAEMLRPSRRSIACSPTWASTPADTGFNSSRRRSTWNQRTHDTSVPLVLWQISVVGATRTTNAVDRDGLQRLADRLTDLYGEEHEVIVYEAAPFPVGRPTIEHVRVVDLPEAPVPGLSSLYVPPRGTP